MESTWQQCHSIHRNIYLACAGFSTQNQRNGCIDTFIWSANYESCVAFFYYNLPRQLIQSQKLSNNRHIHMFNELIFLLQKTKQCFVSHLLNDLFLIGVWVVGCVVCCDYVVYTHIFLVCSISQTLFKYECKVRKKNYSHIRFCR